VRFLCDDPGAKIALGAPGDTGVPVGVLDRVTAEPGATVVLEVAGKTDPVVTLDVSTRQELSLPIHGPLRIVTELARSEPSALGAGSSLSAYEVRLAASDRMIQVRSGEQGIVLVVRPAAGSGGDLLNAWLPVQSVQFVDEQIGGEITSPLLGSGRLRYPDYPDVPPVVVAEDEFVVMNRATGMVLQRMALQHKAPGLQLTLEGRLAEGAIGRPDPGSAPGARTGVWFDPRLTWLQTVRHGSYGVGVGALALWALSTAWLGHRRWKKPTY
jgi:hypothetical protein